MAEQIKLPRNMSNTGAVLLRRVFARGYAAGLRQARKELHMMIRQSDAQIATAQDETRKYVAAEIASLQEEFSAIVRDVHYYRSLERAIDTERDLDARLN